MGEVFRLATETIIYLGPSARRWNLLDDISNDEWRSLLDGPWFSRTWVVQELLLSRKVIIIIGNDRIPWDGLMALCEARALKLPELLSMRDAFMHDYARRPPKSWDDYEDDDDNDVLAALTGTRRPPQSCRAGTDHLSPRSPLHKALEASRSHFEAQSGSGKQALLRRDEHDQSVVKRSGLVNLNYWRLPEVLTRTRHFECQDQRDKLFAILPLFCRPIPQLLYPDYEKTTSQVYTDLAWFMIDQGDLTAFSYLNGSNPVGAPSWATHWPNPPFRNPGWHENSGLVHKAGFGSAPRKVRPQRLGKDGQLIKVRGLRMKLVESTYQVQIQDFNLARTDAIIGLQIISAQRPPSMSDRNLAMQWVWAGRTPDEDIKIRDAIESACSRAFSDVKSWFDASSTDEVHGSMAMRDNGIGSNGRASIRMALCCPDSQARREKMFANLVSYMGDAQRNSRVLIPSDNRHLEYHFFFQCNEYDLLSEYLNFQTGSVAPVRRGDVACVLQGFAFPVLMRQKGRKWQLLRECWIADTDAIKGRVVERLDTLSWWENSCRAPLRDFIIC